MYSRVWRSVRLSVVPKPELHNQDGNALTQGTMFVLHGYFEYALYWLDITHFSQAQDAACLPALCACSAKESVLSWRIFSISFTLVCVFVKHNWSIKYSFNDTMLISKLPKVIIQWYLFRIA